MLKVYNTLTNEKEKFVPLKENEVKMYVCGLTVQNYSHIGHIRSAINYDVIRKYLEYKGYDVIYVQNFTDINEKIVNRAEEEGMKPLELARKYTEAYLEDIDKFNIKRADIYCKATETIDKMKEVIEVLIDKGYAYEVEGNVYFDVKQFEDYGKLSGRDVEEMEAGARMEINKEKKHPLDFALWKKPAEDVKQWDSPWGKGWPGWHIECSAMILKYLGDKIDIHGGGTDLIFPHHENEIAQSEACTGKKPFVKYWLHNGTVNLKGEKMSKSIGNFYTTREILQEFEPEEIRFFLLTKHYHNPIDFSFEEVENSSKNLNKLNNTLIQLKKLQKKETTSGKNNTVERDIDLPYFKEQIEYYRSEFEKAMDNDFNTAEAIGVLNNLVKEINSFINNKQFILTEEIKEILQQAVTLLEDIYMVLGINSKNNLQNQEIKYGRKFKDLVDYILKIRENAREQKDWDLADKIRDDLKEMGIEIKDTPEGVEWELKEE
ncbi:MAG: cysteine--tRNA ligase [Bacillota bacterium]